MRLKYRVLYGIAVIGLVTALAGTVIARASQSGSPTDTEVAFAQQVSDLLLNELVAALFQEFDETTPQNVAHGKQAISLIFNDLNRDIRLVGTFDPLGGDNARPDGNFERRALQLALDGETHTAVQKVNDTWYVSPLGSAEQHVAHGLCALPRQFHPGVFRRNQQPRTVGGRARAASPDRPLKAIVTMIRDIRRAVPPIAIAVGHQHA